MSGRHRVVAGLLTVLAVFWLGPVSVAAQPLETLKAGVVKLYVEKSDGLDDTGSGVVTGLHKGALFILTAYHVVEDAESISVSFNSERWTSYEATLEAYDEVLDIAAVYVKFVGDETAPSDLPKFEIRDSDPRYNENVTAIGHPSDQLSWYPSAENVAGVVSEDPNIFLITRSQSDRGFSGGPVFDSEGALLGLVLSVMGNQTNVVLAEAAVKKLTFWQLPRNHLVQGAEVEASDTEPIVAGAEEEGPLIEVPSLAGMTEEAAREVMEAAGLVAGEVSTSAVWDFDGTVVDQMPADGQSTPSGSAVNLVIADSAIVYVARLLTNASEDGEDLDAAVTYEVKLIKAPNTVEPVGQFTVRNVTARGLGPDLSGLIDELRGEPGYIPLDGVDTASLESVWRAYEERVQNLVYETKVDASDSPQLGPAIMLAMAGGEILFVLRAIFALAEGGFERVETGFELQAADGQFMSAIRAEGPATVSDAGRTRRLDVVRRAASDDTFTRVGSVAYDAADGMLNSLNILFQVTDDAVYRLDVDRL